MLFVVGPVSLHQSTFLSYLSLIYIYTFVFYISKPKIQKSTSVRYTSDSHLELLIKDSYKRLVTNGKAD